MRKADFKSSRGSMIMGAVITATILALAVAGLLALAFNGTRISRSPCHFEQSLNLAETGVEISLDALGKGNWQGWVRDGDNASLLDHRVDLENGREGVINVRVFNLRTNPRVVAEGVVLNPDRSPVTRQIDVRLSRRAPFNGLTARDTILFAGGNAMVDSYNSRKGPYLAAGNQNRNDRGFVAGASIEADAATTSNASIRGYVATGGSRPNVGANGTILGFDSPPGVKVDSSRVGLDFDADFFPVTPPTFYHGHLGTIDRNLSLGNAGSNQPIIYKVDQIRLFNRTLVIEGPVVLHVSGGIRVGGESGEIVVRKTGSLTLYVDGNMDAGGNGVANLSNVPSSLLIYGSAPVSQVIKLHGNGAVHAAVYAPNANVDLKGGGNCGHMAGAVVAKNIYIHGNYSFHCDEALIDFRPAQASYRMDLWRELFAANERVRF